MSASRKIALSAWAHPWVLLPTIFSNHLPINLTVFSYILFSTEIPMYKALFRLGLTYWPMMWEWHAKETQK